MTQIEQGPIKTLVAIENPPLPITGWVKLLLSTSITKYDSNAIMFELVAAANFIRLIEWSVPLIVEGKIYKRDLVHELWQPNPFQNLIPFRLVIVEMDPRYKIGDLSDEQRRDDEARSKSNIPVPGRFTQVSMIE